MGIQTSSSSSSILDPCLHIHRSDNRVASGSSNSDHHHYGHHYDGHHHEGYDDGVVFRQHHDYDDTGDVSGDHSYRVLGGSSSCKGDTTLFAFDYR